MKFPDGKVVATVPTDLSKQGTFYNLVTEYDVVEPTSISYESVRWRSSRRLRRQLQNDKAPSKASPPILTDWWTMLAQETDNDFVESNNGTRYQDSDTIELKRIEGSSKRAVSTSTSEGSMMCRCVGLDSGTYEGVESNVSAPVTAASQLPILGR